MFKKMLVPLDGSSLSEEVLPIAKELLEAGLEEVTLFRVGEVPHGTVRRRRALLRSLPLAPFAGAPVVTPATPLAYAETKGQAVEREEHELLEYLEEAGRALTDTGKVIHAAVHLGDPAREIIDFAGKSGFDVILMATHGRFGLRTTLHESVAAAVIRSGVAPVLVLRPRRRVRREQSQRSGPARHPTGLEAQ
jgi:nucleotide-binding universal stress UspA family protein